MRRAGLLAMLLALAGWLAPAPCLGLCAASAADHSRGCCVSIHETTHEMAHETVHGNCCAPGSVSALPVSPDMKDIARAGAFAGGLWPPETPRRAEFHQANIVAAWIPARPKPPAVLRI